MDSGYRLLLYRPRLPFPIIIFIEIIITFRQYDGEQSKSGNSNLTVGVSILTGRPPAIHPFVRRGTLLCTQLPPTLLSRGTVEGVPI